MDYSSEYLCSARWRRIRKRVLERDAHVCRCCGGRGDQVHHRSYAEDVLEGNNDAMLATVCDGCHNLIHFDEDGGRRSDEECDRLLFAGQTQRDLPEIPIDLRKRIPDLPSGWHRMTAVQRQLWHARYRELRAEKVAARRGRVKTGPPKEPGGLFSKAFWPTAVRRDLLRI